jgi:hypothetical protein
MIPLQLLSSSQRQRLQALETLDLVALARYHVRPGAGPFVVDVDLRALRVLIDSAAVGHRVYELLSIRRPGDVLSYVVLWFRAISEDIRYRLDNWLREPQVPLLRDAKTVGLPFPFVESRLASYPDDRGPSEDLWHDRLDTGCWNQLADDLFEIVRSAQAALRESGDLLIADEIARIDAGTHWRHYRPAIERRLELDGVPPANSELPTALLEFLGQQIARPDIGSVSCCLKDYALWRLLIAEQRRRGGAGDKAQHVFALAGPEGSIAPANPDDWGGAVHIPYEGVLDGDILFLPAWRRFEPELAGDGGRLSRAVGKQCKIVISQRDFGELACATRSVFDSWIVYQDRRQSGPYNPFTDRP